MALIYKLSSITNPKSENNMFGARIDYQDATIFEKLIESVSLKCTVTGVDMVTVIRALVDNIAMNITASRAVSLGEFGTISVGISTRQVVGLKDFDRSKIRGARYTFRPGSKVKSKMKVALNHISKRSLNEVKTSTEEVAE